MKELKFTTPTEVQEKLIPIVLAGRDLVGESKTGSGKTHTFLLPIFQQLDEESDSVQAVITAPSRELATQISSSGSSDRKLIQMLRFVLPTMLVVQTRPVRLTN